MDPDLPGAVDLPNPLRDPRGILERHWRWMLAAFVLGVAASLGARMLRTPRYFAEATVVVARPQIAERIVQPEIEDARIPVTEALAAEVLSRNNLSKLVEEFGLYQELVGVETMAEIVDRVRSRVTIRAVQRLESPASELSERAYSIGFEASTPQAAAGVANRLASSFAETTSVDRARQQQLTITLLRTQLAQTEADLSAQDRAVTEFKQQNRGILPSDLEANLARQASLQNQRQTLAAQIAEDERRGGLLQTTERALNELRRQLAAIDRELDGLDGRVGRMPAVKEQLTSLEERALVARENYVKLLRRVQDAELSASMLGAQQGRRISVLNQAEPPSRPVRSRVPFLGLGLLLSLGLAIAVGLGLEMLHPVVIAPEDITGTVGQPVLGWVTRIH